MARQKQVFERNEMAHLWAHRTQDSARDKGGNFYFTGPTIYSYGSHFAIGHWLEDGRLLWNDASYGPTTSKHQYYARAAVPRYQWERAIHVPHLNQDQTRVRAFPELAKACIGAAMSALEKAQAARQRRGAHLMEAARYLTSARELFILAGDKKSAARVPDVAEDSDRATVGAILAQAKRADYLAEAQRRTERAKTLIHDANIAAQGAEYQSSHQSIGEPWRGMLSPACAVMNLTTAAQKLLREAADYVKRAGDKPKTSIRAALKECTALQASHEAQARADTDAAMIDRVKIEAAPVLECIATYGREVRGKGKLRYSRHSAGANLEWRARRLSEAIAELGEEKRPADAVAILRRADALTSSHGMRQAIAEARADLQAYHANPQENEPPRTGELARMVRGAGERMPRYWRETINNLLRDIYAARAEWDRMRAARNAEAIAQWKAGAPVRPAHDWPTLARIIARNGAVIVETSRGANVPLEHACRLAKIARRVIRNGGASWEPGNGPRVGHFMVQSIGADGSAVIGCHEFSAAEGMRMIAELEAHPVCACVSEAAEV